MLRGLHLTAISLLKSNNACREWDRIWIDFVKVIRVQHTISEKKIEIMLKFSVFWRPRKTMYKIMISLSQTKLTLHTIFFGQITNAILTMNWIWSRISIIMKLNYMHKVITSKVLDEMNGVWERNTPLPFSIPIRKLLYHVTWSPCIR